MLSAYGSCAGEANQLCVRNKNVLIRVFTRIGDDAIKAYARSRTEPT
ncbi:uncharacterized protein J3R85_004450 [Psidium guajava]|nr:uncharacterized protein J3R85_004450 [Psidium guajava]